MFSIGGVKAAGAVLGPTIYLLFLLFEPSQIGVGVLSWLATYWAVSVIPIPYTAAIPIIGFGLAGIPLDQILASFMHPALVVILAPAVMVLAAADCGLMEKVAIRILEVIGTRVRIHVLFWLVFSTVVSCFTANVVAAIAIMPIVLYVLKRVGYTKPAKIALSKSAMLVVIAVAVGSSLGGILTPMAGGQAAITWMTLNQAVGSEVTAWAFASRMLLPVLCSLVIAVALFSVLPIDERFFTGKSIRRTNAWTRRQRWVTCLLVLTFALPFVQQWIPLSLSWSYAVLLLGVLFSQFLPYKVCPPLLPLSFPFKTLSVWPIAMATSTLVGTLGTGAGLFNSLDFVQQAPYLAVGMLVLFCVVFAQIASDTGAAGMIAPLLLGALVAHGENPVPWLLMMGFTVNLCFMIPSATGTIAVPLALSGNNHPSLLLYGSILALACGLFSWLFWSWVISSGVPFFQTLETMG